MKIYNTKFIIIVPMLFILTSCEKDAKDVKEPDFNPKLVLSSFISPSESATYITINTTQRIYGDLSDIISTGKLTVILSDGSKEINVVTTDNSIMISHEKMAIEAGKTYNLTVTNDNGLKAESTCTVPAERDFKIKADTITKITTGEWGTIHVFSAEITITDFPGEPNYYRLYCLEEAYGVPYYEGHEVYRMIEFEDNILKDTGKDGKTFLAGSFELVDYTCDSSFLKIYVMNTDKAYYDFHKSIINYAGGDDPFTEVSPIYSNVEGGLGIFSAYTVDSLIFRLK
jgi:hypothetical protein